MPWPGKLSAALRGQAVFGDAHNGLFLAAPRRTGSPPVSGRPDPKPALEAARRGGGRCGPVGRPAARPRLLDRRRCRPHAGATPGRGEPRGKGCRSGGRDDRWRAEDRPQQDRQDRRCDAARRTSRTARGRQSTGGIDRGRGAACADQRGRRSHDVGAEVPPAINSTGRAKST